MTMCACCAFRKVRKGLWSPDEDEKLRDFVSQHGARGWSQVPLQAGLERCGKSCRLRWLNYLRPGIKRGEFSPEELQLISELQAMYGNRWSWIAQWLPGRTDNEIKNLWNVHMNPKKCKQAIKFEQVTSYRLAVPFKLDGIPEIQQEDADAVPPQQNSVYGTDSGLHVMDRCVLDDMILECMNQNNLFMQPDNSFPCMEESMHWTSSHCVDPWTYHSHSTTNL